MEDMALAHVDDAVAAGLVEADQDPPARLQRPKRRAAAGARRRQMRRADFRLQPMLGQRAGDPGNAIIGIGRVGQMLELAAAAFREVAAWRALVARAGLDRAVVEQHVARHRERDMAAAGGDPVAARGDADDRLRSRERDGNGGDQIVGDHAAARQPRRRGHAARRRRRPRRTRPGPAPASPRSCRPARRRFRRWPARPAPAARSRGGRRATRPAYPAPCRRSPIANAAPPPAPARPCCLRSRRTA